MKIKQHGSLFKTRLLRAFPLVVTFGVVLYSLFEIVISGIVPSRYITIASVVLLLLAGIMIFLWYRYFLTKRRRVVARVTVIILMLILIMISIFGLYVLKRGLSTLDGLSDNTNSVTVDTKRSFNIYISGIDTYGDISTTSRSDVNIVATVNPNTHQILLTTAPRDSYVSIAGGGNGGMDKLTHAGIYGPESSMQTMAQLLDTDIDAYARINFSSFIESIDVLGGITVQNPTAFSIGGQTFPVGNVQLSGKTALLYSRERKSLAEGDVDRGKNQQRVIQGIIDKMTQIRSISGFEGILSMIGTSVDTNMSSSTLRSLINQQLDNPSKWTTDSYTLTGKGQTGGLTSYAMPNSQLYMYVLDESSVEKATVQIKRNLEAE